MGDCYDNPLFLKKFPRHYMHSDLCVMLKPHCVDRLEKVNYYPYCHLLSFWRRITHYSAIKRSLFAL